jgi:hypothetical protein
MAKRTDKKTQIMEEQLILLKKKYGEDAIDYINAKLTIANIEQDYWQKLHDRYLFH